tara:strand:+ start:510 stop:647 length:138 start_codon:yes stop_codon:yes gene_type:complete
LGDVSTSLAAAYRRPLCLARQHSVGLLLRLERVGTHKLTGDTGTL